MTNFKIPLVSFVIWSCITLFVRFILVHNSIYVIVIILLILFSIVFLPILIIFSIIFSIKSFKQRNYVWGITNLLLTIMTVFLLGYFASTSDFNIIPFL
jgi:hypothetical protein